MWKKFNQYIIRSKDQYIINRVGYNGSLFIDPRHPQEQINFWLLRKTIIECAIAMILVKLILPDHPPFPALFILMIILRQITSMPHHAEAVICAKGALTRY